MATNLPLRVERVSHTNPEGKEWPILYKYRDGANPFHLRAITNGELYLSSPADFVDKLDCNLPTDVTLLSTQERLEFVRRSIFNQFPELRLKSPDKQRRQIRYWANKGPINDPAHVQRVFDNAQKDFNNRFGVLCLTANPANEHLWQGYAADFSGFSIGFQPQLFDEYGGGRIIYVPELPVFKGNEDPSTYMVNQILLKRKQYEPEDEFRITRFWPAKPTADQRKIHARPQQVAEVVIGYRASAALTATIQQYLPATPIRVARPNGSGGVLLEPWQI